MLFYLGIQRFMEYPKRRPPNNQRGNATPIFFKVMISSLKYGKINVIKKNIPIPQGRPILRICLSLFDILKIYDAFF